MWSSLQMTVLQITVGTEGYLQHPQMPMKELTNAVLLFLMATAYCFYYGDDCFPGWLINERAFESYFQLGPLLDLTILILVALWHTLSKIYVPANSLNLDIFEWSCATSSRLEVLCKKGVLRNLVKFTGKHLCQGLFFNNVAGP